MYPSERYAPLKGSIMTKKQLLLILTFIAVLSLLASCGGNGNTVSNDASATETAGNSRIVIEDPAKETSEAKSTEPAVSEKPEFTFDPDNYTFVQKFPAPDGEPRDVVMDYMMKMANVEWTPREDFKITRRTNGDFGVDLSYKAGTVYTGMPYSNAYSSYEMFEQYLIDGRFGDSAYYFEDVVGNHCSGSMLVAFQQLIDLPRGTFKPASTREGLLEFPKDENGNEILTKPDYETYKDSWITADLFKVNTKDSVFKAYSMLGKGDILLKAIDGSGHTRLVDHVDLSKTLSGEINYTRSTVTTVEHTNAWEKERSGVNSTWWVNHKYTFTDLYEKLFMPVTLCIYHNGEKPEDAWIGFDGENTPESIHEALNGNVRSNFPLTYVRATVKDKDGKIVSEARSYKFEKTYSVNIRKYQYDLINGLPAGTYTYTLHAGIARGGCDVESFEFTVK